MPPQGGIAEGYAKKLAPVVSSHAPARGHLVLLLLVMDWPVSFKSCPRKGASREQEEKAYRVYVFQVMPPQGGILEPNHAIITRQL